MSNNFFLNLLGIKQTAKLVNSILMELINSVEDKLEDSKEDREVRKLIIIENKYINNIVLGKLHFMI